MSAAELLRQALDRIVAEQARLDRSAEAVRVAIEELGQDPDRPSLAELEEFRPVSPVPVVGEGVDPSAPVVGEAASPPAVSPTRSTGDGWPCPVCGAVFATEQGMRTHRGHKHKSGSPLPLVDLGRLIDRADREPRPTPARPARLVLACESCDTEVAPDQLSVLRRHVRLAHQRELTSADRTPVPSKESAA